MSLGCVMLTCHTVPFVLCLLAFSWLVLLHHILHSFLCHVSSDEGCARRDNKNFISLRVAVNIYIFLEYAVRAQRSPFCAENCPTSASRLWLHVVCAQNLEMTGPVHSPCMALTDGNFIKQWMLINYSKGTELKETSVPPFNSTGNTALLCGQGSVHKSHNDSMLKWLWCNWMSQCHSLLACDLQTKVLNIQQSLSKFD